MNVITAIKILIFLLLGIVCYGQTEHLLENANSKLFKIQNGLDTIKFIKIDKDIETPKPVILILQGSLPIPLGIKYPKGISFTSFPYQLTKELVDEYSFVVITMPDIPIIVNNDEIDKKATYINTPDSYNQKNHLQTYIDRANQVIDFIVQQVWFDSEKGLFLFGHSQGSYVAIKVTNQNPNVTKIGVTGFNPEGRFQRHMRRIRYEEHAGRITSKEAQKQINEYYERWKHISNNKNDNSQKKGDTFKATFSFSENFMDDLLELRRPIFIAYGTSDISSLGCDIIPLEFDRVGKHDYQLNAYPGLGHNFEEIDDNGKSNFDKMHWDQVFNEFVNWLKN